MFILYYACNLFIYPYVYFQCLHTTAERRRIRILARGADRMEVVLQRQDSLKAIKQAEKEIKPEEENKILPWNDGE